MTHKEKAEELVDKFVQYTPADSEFEYPYAKQCALIAVDEMIIQNGELILNGLDGDYYRKKNAFLFEIKQEIEKL